MGRIRIDYDRAIRKAQEIQEISNELKTVSQDLDDLLMRAQSTWKGEASIEYVKQGKVLKTKIQSTSKGVLDLSEKIRFAANDIKRTDEAQAAKNC